MLSDLINRTFFQLEVVGSYAGRGLSDYAHGRGHILKVRCSCGETFYTKRNPLWQCQLTRCARCVRKRKLALWQQMGFALYDAGVVFGKVPSREQMKAIARL